MPAAAPEIKVLAGLIDELDYYQLLELPREAPTSAVRKAYHLLCRRFHPDVNRCLEGEALGQLESIAKRVAEAYSVLRDPRRRRAYDSQLHNGGYRIQLVDAEARAARQSIAETLGRTPNGRRFFALARSEIEKGDLAAAARNLQMAITFEPDNSYFKQKLEEIRSAQR